MLGPLCVGQHDAPGAVQEKIGILGPVSPVRKLPGADASCEESLKFGKNHRFPKRTDERGIVKIRERTHAHEKGAETGVLEMEFG